MKKIILLLGFALSLSVTQAQDSILWAENRPLTWNDFKAPPIDGMPINAMTSARPAITMNSSQTGTDVTINYSVATTFYPNDSWAINKSVELPFLLEHEQLCFDIAELFTRKLRKALQDYSYTENFTDEYQGLYNHYTSARNEYQQLFDMKTNYGGNTKELKKWAKKIEKELEELSNYTKTNFTVNFTAKEVEVEETEE